jgi:hypothetical protein
MGFAQVESWFERKEALYLVTKLPPKGWVGKVREKTFFLFLFLATLWSTTWGNGIEEFKICIDRLLQDRTALERFGYTPDDILEKRLSSFTQELKRYKLHDFQKRSSHPYNQEREANFDLNLAEKESFGLDIGDMQINNENYPSTFNQRLPYVSMFNDRDFIAVWEDERNGDIDIFAQKMTFSGGAAGNNLEVGWESFPTNQLLPCVATTGDTAFVVIWVDEENFDIYGRRFDSDLSPVGDVFQVNDAGVASWAPSLSCGPDGGFVVAWVDTRLGNDIYAKRFDPSGNPLGSSFKVNEDKEIRPHIAPSVSIGKDGDFVIVWEDFRQTDSDIYAQRYNSTGSKLGSNILVNSDSLNEDQYSPSVGLGKSNRFMVTWVDLRSGTENVWARIFSFDGIPQTSILRVDTTTTSEPRESPWIDSDTTGRYMIAWTDYTPSFPTIYAQRFDSLGKTMGSRLTISDLGAEGERHNPTLSTNPSGALAVCWMDKRNLNYDIYARTIRSDGFPQQESSFILNDDSMGANQESPQIAARSDGGFIAVWEDFRNNNSDIYLKKFDSNGLSLGNESRVNDSLGYVNHGLPDIACNDSGKFVVVWQDERVGLDIYGQLFDHLGSPVGGNFKVNGDSATELNNTPSCDMSTSGDFVVVWSAKAGNVPNIYGRTFGSNGQPKDTSFKINDDNQTVDHLSPKVSMDSLGNFVVAWEDKRDGQDGIYLQRYNSNGLKIGSNFPLAGGTKSSARTEPDLDLSHKGEFVVVWIEDQEVFAQRYDSSATPMGSNIPVTNDPSSFPENPQVRVTDDGYFVVAWTDHRREGSDIYFQTYLNGLPHGLNHLVNTDLGNALQISPGIDLWNNYLYSVWMDNRIPGHGFDIFFNTVNFKETGVEDEEEEKDLPKEFSLQQNYPNPFNPSTIIRFKVEGGRSKALIHTTLIIYNILGQKVRTLVDETKSAGSYEVIWDGKDDERKEVAGGIYFYQLIVEDQILTKKMLLLK